ncbi:MAG TPA: tetratricopeptide repeat protein [Pyrinomonadaceae bacterium]|jgi:tetratricopeptide (TPR) repeat protein|nr:tetratricopeptide repeat protein [Pyrinomonadaceae bacterium]
MGEQVALIKLSPVWARLPLALLALAALAASWYGMRWMIGDTMADAAPLSFQNDQLAAFETAEAAARLAPHDPLTYLTLARLHRYSFDPELLPRALSEYERAAALAPNDYQIWTELGRARATAGDMEGGVAALRRAVALAPNYAEQRWHLGNALLRAGRNGDAFEELRRAGDADPDKYRPQVFNLAWQLYGPDMSRVLDAVGKSPGARAHLVLVLVGRGRLEDALNVWASLGPDVRRDAAAVGEKLAQALYGAGQYKRAAQVLAEAGSQDLSAGKVSNGGFETDVGRAGQLFRWQVTPLAGARIAVDARVARSGARSLLVLFESANHVDFRNVWQAVAVEPDARYRLTYFVRTDSLNSAATLQTLVTNAANESEVLASSQPVPSGTNDWQQVALEFTAPKAEAVVVRLVRAGCPGGACPAYGKIWYDDFDLQRAAGRAPTR